MRVGDSEREAAAAELREHFTSGRLDQEELNDRLTAVFAAKTRGDLQALFADLPSSERDWTGAGTSGTGQGFNPGSWGHSGSWDDSGSWGAADGTRRNARAGAGERVTAGVGAVLCLVPVLAVLGVVSLLTLGHGRPVGIIFVLAALAVLRRLLLSIFGRGMRRRGHGPHRKSRR
jgi:hypothetical protein